MLEHLLIKRLTTILNASVDPVNAAASALVERTWCWPNVFGGKPLFRSIHVCVCHDIFRRQVRWFDINGMDELLPNDKIAKALSARLRTELINLAGEGR